MKRKQPRAETNEEFIVRIMNFGCPTGALIQPFIIEALAKYCDLIKDTELTANGLVEPQAWKDTAAWLRGEIDKRYGGNTYEAE